MCFAIFVCFSFLLFFSFILKELFCAYSHSFSGQGGSAPASSHPSLLFFFFSTQSSAEEVNRLTKSSRTQAAKSKSLQVGALELDGDGCLCWGSWRVLS